VERKEALDYITAKLDEGIPKHIIYRDLLSKFTSKDELLAYVSEVPDVRIRTELQTKNNILITILCLVLIINTLYVAAYVVMGTKAQIIPWLLLGGWAYILVPFFLLCIISEIRKFRRNGYRYVFILTVSVIGMHAMAHSLLLDWLLVVGPWLPAAFLSISIMKITHPYDSLFKSIDRTRLEKDLTSANISSDINDNKI